MSAFKEELLELLQKPELPENTLRQRLQKILGESGKISKMSFEEFLEWADEDTLAEWVNGVVINYAPKPLLHQEILGFLLDIVDEYDRVKELGTVLPIPFQMKLSNSGREPDLLFVKKEHLGRLKETYLDGPADMVVEIISPECIGRDRGEQFYEYEQA